MYLYLVDENALQDHEQALSYTVKIKEGTDRLLAKMLVDHAITVGKEKYWQDQNDPEECDLHCEGDYVKCEIEKLNCVESVELVGEDDILYW